MIKKLLFLFIFTYSTTHTSVEHKHEHISQYLQDICYNQSEKTQIIPYINQNPNGCYMDIGTGGDALAIILKNISPQAQTTLIASDLDQSVLDAIPQRHPEIKTFLNQDSKKKSPQVKFIAMNATDMKPIESDSIDGISASALVHEIFSYSSLSNPLKQFFFEVSRTLKPNGVFIYRDPLWVDHPEQQVVLSIKNNLCKYFCTLFLPRFFDQTFSRMKHNNQCIKPKLYNAEKIQIKVYTKSGNILHLSLSQFIATPTDHIDFEHDMVIQGPHGLISEIQRHYVLFLRDTYPLHLIDEDLINQPFLSLDAIHRQALTTFRYMLEKNNIPIVYNIVEQKDLQKILSQSLQFIEFVKNGLEIKINNTTKIKQIITTLHAAGIPPEILYLRDQNTLYIDPKVVSLLFQDDKDIISTLLSEHDYWYPKKALMWIQREGEEFYYYKNTDDLITFIGKISYLNLKNSHKDGYMLCPINEESITVAPRYLYTHILTKDMQVTTLNNTVCAPITGKNIIHFKLQPKEQAIKIYRKIINKQPNRFKQLKKWVEYELQ